MGKSKVKIGFIDIPKDYIELDMDDRIVVVDKLIDVLLMKIDKNLPPYQNRVTFLMEVLESTLETNIEDETYEVATVIRDCINRLNEA
jgi:hypothetical protein